MDNAQHINFFTLFTGLIGGLALFLYGLDKMGNTLKLISSGKLKLIITKLTKNRITSLFTGTVLTALVQSSTATTVILVGFVSAEMLTLRQALGVILGADIGTTVTVQLIAFKITKYALIPVALGFFIKAISKDEKFQNIGRTLLGVGLLFYGIELMSMAVHPLREHQGFIGIMTGLENPLLAIAFGALFTATVQSSAATLAIIVALASQNLINVQAGLCLMLGANIGTCLTAIVACIGKSRAAQRTAAAHVLFKVVGVILILPFLTEFETIVRYVYPHHDLATASPRDIANAHLLFNTFIALIFLPIIPLVATVLQKIIPHKVVNTRMKTKYIDPALYETPGVAIAAARREIYRTGIHISRMLDDILPAIQAKDKKALNELKKYDEFIDFLYESITKYLINLTSTELTQTQSQEIMLLTRTINDLETIGDIIKRDLVEMGKKYIDEDMEFTENLETPTVKTFQVIKDSFQLAILSINEPNTEFYATINAKKASITRQVNNISHEKLKLKTSKNLNYYSLCNDLVDTFARIFYYSRKISKNLLTQEITNERL